MTTSTKQSFCESVLSDLRLTWHDLTGMMQLSHDRIARVELDTGSTSGTYIGFRVKIIHKVTGLIDAKFFLFRDYLSNEHPDGQHGHRIPLCVIDYVGWWWHIAAPKSTQPLTDAIASYIDTFKVGA